MGRGGRAARRSAAIERAAEPGRGHRRGQRRGRARPASSCARPARLPGDLHKLWRARDPAGKGYHVEYGYSCMGYEIPGGMGVKLAAPEREVFVMVGDGSYLMLPGRARDRGGRADRDRDRAGRQPRLRVDRRAVAVGRLAGFGTHYRFAATCRSPLDGAAARAAAAAAGRPRGERREPRAAGHPRPRRSPSCASARRRARRRRAGRDLHRGRPLRGRAELRELVGRAGRRGLRGGSGAAGRAAAYERDRAAQRQYYSCERAARPSAAPPEPDGTLLRVTPASAGWGHVGFELLELAAGRAARARHRRPRAVHRRRRRRRARALRARRVARPRRPRRRRSTAPPDAAYLPPGAPSRSRARATARRSRCAGRRRPAAARPPAGSRPRRRASRRAGTARTSASSDPILMDDSRGRVAAGLRGAHARPGTGRATRRTSTTATTLPARVAARGDLLPPGRRPRRASGSSASTPTTARWTRR